MQIIKDKQLIDNTWSYISEEDDLKAGDITVPVSRWKKDKQQLLSRDSKLGLRLTPDDSIEELADDLEKFAVIELYFPAYADGRQFSRAWLLRGRHRYPGEIRATGHYLPDQVFYLSRVGVNAFNPEKQEELALILANLNDFSVKYQNSID